MATITRRSFMEMAVALGATAVWGQPTCYAVQDRDGTSAGTSIRKVWHPGIPKATASFYGLVVRQATGKTSGETDAEVAEDESFTRVVAMAETPISGSFRLDLPRAGWRIEAGPSLLVPLYGCRW